MSQNANTAQRSRELEDAFHVFTQLSSQLEGSYRELEVQVARLNEELAAARSERLAQLAEKERLADRLGTLLATLPGAVVVLDGTGRVAECNPGAHDFLGAPLLGEAWTEIAARALTRTADANNEFLLADGRCLSLASRSLGTEPGEILLFTDVTETRALQAEADRHRRLSAMGEMAASLAHQIRTPLAAAMLYVSHLQQPRLAEAQRGMVTGKILDRLRHLEHLVNDMLVFARGGAIVDDVIDMDALLDHLRQHLEVPLAAQQAQLVIANHARGARLRGNQEALLGALVNLGENALQAGGAHVQLAFEVAGGGEQLIIRCSDNGPGIPADIGERVFEPFFTTRSDGTGLGLAVVRAVVEAHHGRITLTPVAQGACFEITLPCLPAATGQTVAARAAMSTRHGRPTLVATR